MGASHLGLAVLDPLRVAPSERFYEKKARAHKKLTDWGRQMVMQVRRWLPERQLVTLAPTASAGVVADSSLP